MVTGLLYQWLFAKRPNRNQWLGIVLITMGCMCKESAKLTSAPALHASAHAWALLAAQVTCTARSSMHTPCACPHNVHPADPCTLWARLAPQLLASVFAGVYTEVLLKGSVGPGVTTNLQNVYMYAHSIVWNSAFLLAQVMRLDCTLDGLDATRDDTLDDILDDALDYTRMNRPSCSRRAGSGRPRRTPTSRRCARRRCSASWP